MEGVGVSMSWEEGVNAEVVGSSSSTSRSRSERRCHLRMIAVRPMIFASGIETEEERLQPQVL